MEVAFGDFPILGSVDSFPSFNPSCSGSGFRGSANVGWNGGANEVSILLVVEVAFGERARAVAAAVVPVSILLVVEVAFGGGGFVNRCKRFAWFQSFL